MGDPASEDFVLRITGRALAPTALSYNLSESAGVAAVVDLRVELFDPAATVRVIAKPELTVFSPRRLDARVVGAPLPPNRYGVRVVGGAVVELLDAFLVEVSPEDPRNAPDAGPTTPGDTGAGGDGGAPTDAIRADTAIDDAGPTGDAGVGLDSEVPSDATPPEVGPADGGTEDADAPPDSGLGAFPGAFAHRQRVRPTNGTGDSAPAGTTIRLPIAHGTLVALGAARADGTDVALYLGAAQLPHQWDDPTALGTDALVMIAKLTSDYRAPPGAGDADLVLYYGDPTAAVTVTDAVYAFVERFRTPVASDWATNGWFPCDFDRPLEANTAPGSGSAYCGTDSATNPTRRTLATPNLPVITTSLAPNQIYEVSAWTAGRMINQTNDLFYFALGPNNAEYVDTHLLPASSYVEFSPNVTAFSFPERDGTTRVVDGWRFPSTFMWWTRLRGRFRPPYGGPSLHVRLVSKDGADNAATGVVLDDYSVRLAIEPELELTLDPVESR